MLISRKTAIIPTGTSCMQGRQIENAATIFGKKLNTNFKSESSFFKFIYQEPWGLPIIFDKYVRQNQEILVEDIKIEDHYSKCPYLAPTGSWFVHHEPFNEIRETGIIRTDEQRLINVQEKYNYLLKKMKNLATIPKRYFIFGNADIDVMLWKRYTEGRIIWRFTKQNVEDTCKAINRAFPTGENVLIFVTNRRNVISGLDCCYIYVLDDADDWHGENAGWENVFDTLPSSTSNESVNFSRNAQYLATRNPHVRRLDAYNPAMQSHSTQVNRKDGHFLISCDEGGDIIWGPYIRLSPGKYEAVIEFLPFPPTKWSKILIWKHNVTKAHIKHSGIFKIKADSGNKILGECVVTQDIVSADGLIRVPLTISEDTYKVELTLFGDKGFQAHVAYFALKAL
ncbi:hypothetical protein GT348_02365 [Aristophania vespae]|uniref:Uncharacterized protein n=1 Tax=Aristophania vespae TaxID=2697033 RepID=A0A6P1NK88_9PROT|nr:hypothetical protein [Aristophania vespae]QHI95271.1 hypothetical protein GT348_02365 [Aristophania vespae]